MSKRALTLAVAFIATTATAVALASFGAPPLDAANGQRDAVGESLDAASHLRDAESHPRAATRIPWRLNNPDPIVVPVAEVNPAVVVVPAGTVDPAAVALKSAARARAMEGRAQLRAYEGAPPVIPHSIADLNVQTCRSCHAQGLQVGDQVAKMVSHTYMTNCTQCHVEASTTFPASVAIVDPPNSFDGKRASGHGGTRAWSGAPPVMPHSLFMRTNCVSCHGEHGYDGWQPDHLSRTNCVQCHAPAAEFDQLAPSFGVPDVADGTRAGTVR